MADEKRLSMAEIIDQTEKKSMSSHSLMADLKQMFGDLRDGLEVHKMDDGVLHRKQAIALLDLVLQGPDLTIRARLERIIQELNDHKGAFTDSAIEHIKATM